LAVHTAERAKTRSGCDANIHFEVPPETIPMD